MKNNILSIVIQARRARGFTLVELLFAVFFIFAALVAIVVTTNNVTDTGKHNQAVAEIRTLIGGARAWKSQPVRAGVGNYSGMTIQALVAAGIDVAPFKKNGGDNAAYGYRTELKPWKTGLYIVYGMGKRETKACNALLDKFRTDAQLDKTSRCSEADTDGYLRLFYHR